MSCCGVNRPLLPGCKLSECHVAEDQLVCPQGWSILHGHGGCWKCRESPHCSCPCSCHLLGRCISSVKNLRARIKWDIKYWVQSLTWSKLSINASCYLLLPNRVLTPRCYYHLHEQTNYCHSDSRCTKPCSHATTQTYFSLQQGMIKITSCSHISLYTLICESVKRYWTSLCGQHDKLPMEW